MKHVVSLNGLDKSGKTTQAARLNEHYKLAHLVGKLRRYDTWPQLEGMDSFNWWFKRGPAEDFVRTIYTNIAKRNQEVRDLDYPLVLVDRGNLMFDAVCMTVTSLKEDCSVSKAAKLVERVKTELGISNPADLNLFFMHGNNAEEMFTKSFERGDIEGLDSESKKLYQRYQRVLTGILIDQVNSGIYQVIDATQPVESVFANTRRTINDLVRAELDLSGLDLLVGLGGLSESGKSSIGKYLEKKGFARVKISRIIEAIETRYSDKLAHVPEKVHGISYDLLVPLFLEQLMKSYTGNIVIESLHGPEFASELKHIVGRKFQIVYVDTPEELRIKRNATDQSIGIDESRKDVERKDRTKLVRGAHKIRHLADVLIDNSGSVQDSISQLNRGLKL